jgi:uncharacterized protein (TIGR03083 family)
MASLNTAQIINGLDEVWNSILEATDGLKEISWDLPTDCPGWDVSDQLSHLVGVELLLLGVKAPEVDLGARDYLKSDFAASLESWIEVRRGESGKTIRKEFAEVTQQRLAVLSALDEAAFDKIGWSPIGEVPMRKFMEIRIMDSWVHEQDIRIALGRPGGRNGAGEQVTLSRADAVLGSVVSRGAQAPEGTAVAIEVVGPIGGRRRIQITDGRGVHSAGDTAEVTITLSQETYVRRFCGRISLDEVIADPTTSIEGDRDLGLRVLEALAVMI